MTSTGPRRVVIIGAGGFGRETASVIAALAEHEMIEAVGFLDDAPDLVGTTPAGLPVLGSVDQARSLQEELFTVSIGNPSRYDAKEKIVLQLGLDPGRYITLIHPKASVGTGVSIGEGSVILAGAVITQGARVGKHVGIMPNVVITHDDTIEDFVTIGAGTTIAGSVTVEHGAYIGAGATIGEGLTIGRGALVGMGAVVTRDVPPQETWIGVPARRMP